MENKPLMRMMKITYRTWTQYLQKLSALADVPNTYRPVIMFVSRHEGASQRMIAQHLDITYAAVSQTVKDMIRDGYLRRESNCEDLRSTKLFLTEKGVCAKGRLFEKINDADAMITQTIGKENEREMLRLMQIICDTVERKCDNA